VNDRGDHVRQAPDMVGNRIATSVARILRPGDRAGKRLLAAIAMGNQLWTLHAR
jgi:hypothetical protein